MGPEESEAVEPYRYPGHIDGRTFQPAGSSCFLEGLRHGAEIGFAEMNSTGDGEARACGAQ